MSKFATILIASALGLLTALPSEAMPLPESSSQSSLLVQVADGCGGGRYRGPGGACHPFGRGPFPGGYHGAYRQARNGCAPGSWRGPWGHCRDTPYHGRLPGGGWK
jgi:hypothetical protein